MRGMEKAVRKSLEELQKIADRPRSLEEKFKTMNDLYETNFYQPEVPPAPAPPHDEGGEILD